MSKKDKLSSITAGLGEALDKMDPPAQDAKPRTAPGQLIAFRNEMATYEDRIAALEAALTDAKRTEIPVELIAPNPWQPRTYFDPKEISDLAASIAEVGLIQPIIVRRVQSLDTASQSKSVQTLDTESEADGCVQSLDTRYELIAGERRLRAHKELARATIKAIIIVATDDELAVMALAENLDRADLADYEISKAIRRAEKEFPNRKHMAKAIGIERSDFYRYLAFDALPEFIKSDLDVTPRLLGRFAAERVASILKARGTPAIDVLAGLWKRVKAGQADQTKLADAISVALTRGHTIRTDRDIKKLFVGQEQAGSITRDASSLTIKIKSAALIGDQEGRLRAFVEGLLKGA